MRLRLAVSLSLSLAAGVLGSACSTTTAGADAAPGSAGLEGGPDVTDVTDATATDAGLDAAADARAACCPPDPTRSGCMSLGGSATWDGGCPPRTCDFFCSTNWRLEDDPAGCPTWRWDLRAPLPDETSACFKKLDAATD